VQGYHVGAGQVKVTHRNIPAEGYTYTFTSDYEYQAWNCTLAYPRAKISIQVITLAIYALRSTFIAMKERDVRYLLLLRGLPAIIQSVFYEKLVPKCGNRRSDEVPQGVRVDSSVPRREIK
jgi:hypothetical protein